MNSNFVRYRVDPRPSGIAGQEIRALRSFAPELHVKMFGTEAGHPEDARCDESRAIPPAYETIYFASHPNPGAH